MVRFVEYLYHIPRYSNHQWTKDKPLYKDGKWWYIAYCCDAIMRVE